MAERKVYGIFNDANWTYLFNKESAVKMAKFYKCEIRTISYGLYSDAGKVWDRPTFYTQSVQIADYR